MRGWVFRIAIIAVIGLGAVIFRDRLSSNAGDLKVGDCFDDPIGTETIKDVQHHPCTEAHTAEVIYLGTMPGTDAVYPADAGVESYLATTCLPAWQTYTGRAYQADEVLGLGYLMPTSAGWAKGDRGITCYAVRADGAPMTSSVRKAP